MKKKMTIIILTLGVFSIINTEMGIIGILPLIADKYQVSITDAGLLVSLFALAVAIAGPTMPLLFSGMNQKKAMLLVLGMFLSCNIVAALTNNFTVVLMTRVIPAFFHPIYVSLAFTVAGNSVSEKEAPKAVSKVMLGVSAGMVIGVPVVSFIANITSLNIAMWSFAVVSFIAFMITMIAMPSLPVSEKLSYGKQLHCLKHSLTWVSIMAVVLLNGSIFGVYSYFANYLGAVTGMSEQLISFVLLVYGSANMIGNMIGGKQLSERAIRFVLLFPILLAIVYLVLWFMGSLNIPMMILTFLWGILAGAAGNINQYWITSAIHDAPTFGNGLFLAASNLGTTIGTTICGFFITMMGTSAMVLGGILLLSLSMLMIVYRVFRLQPNTQQ